MPSECERRVCRYALADGGGGGGLALRERYGADYELLLPGARVHAAAGGDALSPAPPLASAHVASVLAVFTTELSPALIGRIGLDAEVAAMHTLAVVFPLLAGSLQVRTHVRAAARE